MVLNKTIYFYNTKGRKKQEFKPIRKDTVKYYSCGPTVYDYPHIGNMFSFTLSDLLRRLFSFWGYNVVQVMNITDVGHLTHDADMGEEDRIMKALNRWKTQGKKNITVYDIVDYYTAFFVKYLIITNIKLPTFMPFASHHIKEMQDIISCLVKKGYAYKTKTAVYYNVEKFKEYNKLYPQALHEKIIQARKEVKVDKTKKHPADFRLWQLDQPNHILQWDSPWGRGFPGWHIECSAMSMKYCGHTLDIHTGGIDHIPLHHTNEIAQSEACTNKEYANYWLHNQHVKITGEKMAKSLGNFKTLDDLINNGYKPWHIKMFYTLHHYRSVVDFTDKALEHAIDVYDKFLMFFQVAKTRFLHENVSLQAKADFLVEIIYKLFVELKTWADSINVLNNQKTLPELLELLKNRELSYINILKQNYDGAMPKIKDTEVLTYKKVVDLAKQSLRENLISEHEFTIINQSVEELLSFIADDLATPKLWSHAINSLKKNYTKNPIINLFIIAIVSYLTGVSIMPFIIPIDLEYLEYYNNLGLNIKVIDTLSLHNLSNYKEILIHVKKIKEARQKKDYETADIYKKELLDSFSIRKIIDLPDISIPIV